MYIGFEIFSLIDGLKNIESSVSALGINFHYKSMSRGVIDIKDISYFIISIIIFLEATRLVLLSSKWKKN